MKYKVLFTVTHIKKLAVRSGYRPDWISSYKPEYHCAQLIFEGKESLAPGEQYKCILEPLHPELWETVIINDTLLCMEGPRQVGEALVIEVIP